MRKYIILVITSLLFLQSCDNEDYTDLRYVEVNVIRKVYTNTPGVPIIISPYKGGELIIKENWEHSYKTKNYFAGLDASCDNKTVLITLEIYKNGKLLDRIQGNGKVSISCRLKGKKG
ncbi:MAG: hypothetical protein Q3992_00795 [Bacteroides sp.]|nr:hypothetical protein [Bacteroides sp.]